MRADVTQLFGKLFSNNDDGSRGQMGRCKSLKGSLVLKSRAASKI